MSRYTAMQDALYDSAQIACETSVTQAPVAGSGLSDSPDVQFRHTVKLDVTLPPDVLSRATDSDYTRLDDLVGQLTTALPALIRGYLHLPSGGYEPGLDKRNASFKSFITDSVQRCRDDFERGPEHLATTATTRRCSCIGRPHQQYVKTIATESQPFPELSAFKGLAPWEIETAEQAAGAGIDTDTALDFARVARSIAREIQPMDWTTAEISQDALDMWRGTLSTMGRESKLSEGEKSLLRPVCEALVRHTHVEAREILRELGRPVE